MNLKSFTIKHLPSSFHYAYNIFENKRLLKKSVQCILHECNDKILYLNMHMEAYRKAYHFY